MRIWFLSHGLQFFQLIDFLQWAGGWPMSLILSGRGRGRLISVNWSPPWSTECQASQHYTVKPCLKNTLTPQKCVWLICTLIQMHQDLDHTIHSTAQNKQQQQWRRLRKHTHVQKPNRKLKKKPLELFIFLVPGKCPSQMSTNYEVVNISRTQ